MLRLNLRTKLVLAFGLIALVSSAAIELTTSVRLHSYFATSTTEKNAQILQQFNGNIGSDLDSVQKTLTYLAFNVTVQDYFATGETLTQREQLDQIYEVEEMLGTMLSYNNLITAVNLFPAKWADRIYVDKSAYFSLPDYPYEKDWYLELAEGKSVKTSYISETRTSKTRYNMVRKVLDPATSEWIGIVVVSYDIENLDAFAGAFDLGDEGIVAVYDQNQIIYRTDNGDDTEYGRRCAATAPGRMEVPWKSSRAGYAGELRALGHHRLADPERHPHGLYQPCAAPGNIHQLHRVCVHAAGDRAGLPAAFQDHQPPDCQPENAYAAGDGG